MGEKEIENENEKHKEREISEQKKEEIQRTGKLEDRTKPRAVKGKTKREKQWHFKDLSMLEEIHQPRLRR